MYRIKNTAEDRTKHLLHRTAAKFELEPNLGGIRIRLGSYLDITDEHYDRVKPFVDEWVKKGMVEVVQLNSDGSDIRKSASEPEYDTNGLKIGGPTFEEWVKAGYPDHAYPPPDFTEIPSIGLTAFRIEQEKARKQIADLATAAIREELNRPPTISQILPAISIQEPEVQPEPTVIIEPEPAPPVVQAPSPTPNKQQDKNKKLR